MDTPYPGLRPFREDENEIFKGRQKHIDKLLELLSYNRFVSVIGASGCGKSSLVEAGLLPMLRKSQSLTEWRVAKFRPGSRPITALTKALLDKKAIARERAGIDNKEKYLYATLSSNSTGIADVICETPLPNNSKLLIIVDQFEEIFRSMHYSDNDEVRSFVYLLIEAIMQNQVPIYVIITMRSDFIGECASFYNLAELIGENIFLTPRLTKKQYRDIITLPAQFFGAMVEPTLVTKLINDMDSNQDQLPVLQHALMRMWFESAQEEKKFTLEDYENIGTLKNSLSKHANELYCELNIQQQQTASILFKCLVEHSKNHGDMRRSITVMDAAKIAKVDEKDIEIIVKKYSEANCNFLTFSSTDKVIDITHESLIRQWDKLNQWKEEEKETASTYFEIVRKEKTKDYLVKLSLEKAIEWQKGVIPNEFWALRYNEELDEKHKKNTNFQDIVKFISKSKIKNDEDIKLKEKQKKQKRNIYFFFISLLLIAFLTIAVLFWDVKNERSKQITSLYQSYIKHASLQSKINNFSQVRSILTKTKQLELKHEIPSDRIFARNLIAWYTNFVSSEPLESYDIALDRHIFPEKSAVTHDGHFFFVGTSNGKILKYDLFEKKIIFSFIAHKSAVTSLAIHPENKWFVSSSDEGIIKFWSFEDKKLINKWYSNEYKYSNDKKQTTENEDAYFIDFVTETQTQSKSFTKTLKFPDNKISFHMQLSPDGKYIAYGYNSILIKTTDNNCDGTFLDKKPLYPQYTIDEISFSYDSKYIAIASYIEVYMKQINNPNKEIQHNEIKSVFPTTSEISGLSFHPKESLLAISTSNKTHVYDYKYGKLRFEIPSIDTDISKSVFDQHGNIISTSLDKKIFVQNVNGTVIKVFQGHNHCILDVLKSNDYYFSIDNRGNIKKWGVLSNTELFSEKSMYEQEPKVVKISPDLSKYLIGCSNGNIAMNYLDTYEAIWTDKISHSIIDLSYSPDAKWIAQIDSSKHLTIRNSLNGKIENQVILKYNPSDCTFSPDSDYIAIACDKGIFCLYSLLNKKIQYYPNNNEIHEKENFISIEYNDNGDKLLTSSNSGFVHIWKSPSWKKFTEIEISKNRINFSLFREDNQQVVSGGVDQRLYLIYEEKNTFFSFSSHENEIVKAMLFPNNQQLISVGNDRTLRVFDFPSATELFSLKLPVEKFEYPVNDLDLYCVKDMCIGAVVLENKVVFYKF